MPRASFLKSYREGLSYPGGMDSELDLTGHNIFSVMVMTSGLVYSCSGYIVETMIE